jgi:hypothetical protein
VVVIGEEGELVSNLLCRIYIITFMSNMGLCISVYMSFICNICASRPCM